MKRWRLRVDDGAVLTGQTTGTGPVTVALLHGGASNRRWWDHVTPPLADRYTVLRWDHRGHGDSTLGISPCTIPRLAEDTRAVLARHATAVVVLVGHSVGAAVALAVAAGHDGVAGVAAIEGGLRSLRDQYPTWPDARKHLLASRRDTTSAAIGAWLPTAGLPATAAAAVLANFTHSGDGRLGLRLPADVEEQLAHSWWAQSTSDLLAAVPVPVLAVSSVGSAADANAAWGCLASARKTTGGRLRHWWVIGGGHHLPLQQPQTVVAAVELVARSAHAIPHR